MSGRHKIGGISVTKDRTSKQAELRNELQVCKKEILDLMERFPSLGVRELGPPEIIKQFDCIKLRLKQLVDDFDVPSGNHSRAGSYPHEILLLEILYLWIYLHQLVESD